MTDYLRRVATNWMEHNADTHLWDGMLYTYIAIWMAGAHVGNYGDQSRVVAKGKECFDRLQG